MNDNNEVHLKCSCYSHELHIEKDGDGNQWYISIWNRGNNINYSWQYRIRHIWRIITKGHPYEDELVMDESEMIKLRAYVNAQISDKIT